MDSDEQNLLDYEEEFAFDLDFESNVRIKMLVCLPLKNYSEHHLNDPYFLNLFSALSL